MKNKCIVFGRNYNDIDCRVPLILELSRKNSCAVEIITIPTSSSTGLSVRHSISNLNEISFQNLFNILCNKYIYMLILWLFRNFELNNSSIVKFRIWPLVWKSVLNFLFNRRFERKLLCYLKNKLIIIDDIYLEPNRSPIVDFLHRHRELSVYCLSHGQNTLTNLWYDVASINSREKFDARNIDVYVPSQIDIGDLNRKAKNFNPIVIGNTRFDKYWIENYPLRLKEMKLQTNFDYRFKILFTMSKLNYGQDAKEVRDLILQIVSDYNVILCLKPHTRGMKLDELKLPDLENLIVEEHCETTDLITWADLVLFTGSSIVFEAFIRKKPVVYLKRLQKYDSIFDNLPQLNIYDGRIDICQVIRNALEHPELAFSSDEYLNENVFGHTGGSVCETFITKYLF